MHSSDTVQNTAFLRPNSKSFKQQSFVMPMKDSLASTQWLNQSSALSNRLVASAVKSAGTTNSKRSITIMRPESIKRANNDAW